MAKLTIRGGAKLQGAIRVHGAKNSILPILAATLVTRGQSVIHNCPDLSDVRSASEILRYLGCRVEREGQTILVDSDGFCRCDIPERLMREMRSSIVFLGAIAARMGGAVLCPPGGCDLGPRPIDLHLAGLSQLGLHVREEEGVLDCGAPSGLHGAEIRLALPSVGATENLMIAATLAKGDTVIRNAAREPEIADLASFLNRCGARIAGAGTSEVRIKGVSRLTAAEHRVIPDRIAAATYLSAAAATGGNLLLQEVNPGHLRAVLPRFEEAGCRLALYRDAVRISAPARLKAVGLVETEPYPGFPTDAQAPFMAMQAVAEGESVFVENIFESRYKHVRDLCRMGAHIEIGGKQAVVRGVRRLHGESVRAADLRGGAALVTAGLCAEGVTEIDGIAHIDRGYENIEDVLSAVGADIKRVETWQRIEENRPVLPTPQTMYAG